MKKFGRLGKLWRKIKKEALSRKSPHEIALGIGAGFFLGVFPVQGFKTPLVVVIGTFYKKINIPALFFASSVLSFPVVVPFVYFFDYWVGAKLLRLPILLSPHSFRHFGLKMLGSSIGALFAGAVLVGVAFGILSYFVSRLVVRLKRG